MLFSGKAKAARSGKIKRARISGNFADYESKVAAAQAFFEREQRVFRRGGSNMDQAVAQLCRKAG